MKRIVLSLTYLFIYIGVLSAQGVIRDINTEKFPEVSFVVQSFIPDTLTNISVKEEGQLVESRSEIISIDSTIIAKECNVLFLWDLKDNKGNGDFVPKMLKNLFKNKPQCKINVAVFGKDNQGGPFHEFLLPSFTNDFGVIEDKVREEVGKQRNVNSQTSDILYVLNQVVSGMDKLPADEAKAIILYTTGKNNTETGIETQPLVTLARKYRIFIYVVNIDGDVAGQTFCESLAKRTYGLYLNTSYREVNENDTIPENETINQWIESLPKRWGGITYHVSFSSHYNRNGESKQIAVVLGEETLYTTYIIPKYSFGNWIGDHVLLFIILFVMMLALIGAGLFFLIRHLRYKAEDRKEMKKKREAERQKLKSEHDTLFRKLNMAETEQRRKQEQEILREKAMKRQEYLDSINTLMHSRNIKARLLVSTMSGSFDYIIDTAETSIGTADDNNIVIEDTTVSRHHAIVYFNGEVFGIKDLNSTNGVVMNGFKVNDLKLRNGDIVSLGNTTIKIYF